MIEISTRRGIRSLIRLPRGGGQYTFGPTFNYLPTWQMRREIHDVSNNTICKP